MSLFGITRAARPQRPTLSGISAVYLITTAFPFVSPMLHAEEARDRITALAAQSDIEP